MGGSHGGYRGKGNKRGEKKKILNLKKKKRESWVYSKNRNSLKEKKKKDQKAIQNLYKKREKRKKRRGASLVSESRPRFLRNYREGRKRRSKPITLRKVAGKKNKQKKKKKANRNLEFKKKIY